jgi:hypothetical protein
MSITISPTLGPRFTVKANRAYALVQDGLKTNTVASFDISDVIDGKTEAEKLATNLNTTHTTHFRTVTASDLTMGELAFTTSGDLCVRMQDMDGPYMLCLRDGFAFRSRVTLYRVPANGAPITYTSTYEA